MIRIRFHGRSGQGMQTACRIVGAAACREGRYAQDFPLAGAERRGVPMVAFTRIADEPILERGRIGAPDLVVVADSTLLDDPQAKPLRGLTASGGVLVNTQSTPTALREQYDMPEVLAVLGGTELALTQVGSIAGLSVVLGAATCKLIGLSLGATEYAVRQELETLGIDRPRIEQNLVLARLGYEQVITAPTLPPPVPTVASIPIPAQSGVVRTTSQGALRKMLAGLMPVDTPPCSVGHWRVWRPMIDLSRCTRCWICFVSCPHGAIVLDERDYPHIDYDVCKGSLICVQECPTKTIHRVLEADA